MYAIIDFKGAQFKVEKDAIIKVPYLADKAVGSLVEMDRVLMVRDDQNLIIGQPTVADAKVMAEVVAQVKDPKVIVFHMKRRKGYQKKNGHKQKYTQLKITDIRK